MPFSGESLCEYAFKYMLLQNFLNHITFEKERPTLMPLGNVRRPPACLLFKGTFMKNAGQVRHDEFDASVAQVVVDGEPAFRFFFFIEKDCPFFERKSPHAALHQKPFSNSITLYLNQSTLSRTPALRKNAGSFARPRATASSPAEPLYFKRRDKRGPFQKWTSVINAFTLATKTLAMAQFPLPALFSSLVSRRTCRVRPQQSSSLFATQ